MATRHRAPGGITCAEFAGSNCGSARRRANCGFARRYWRSDPSSDAVQEITIDLGGERKLATVEIIWEAPPESFSVQVSKDGASWTDVYSTDVRGAGVRPPWSRV